MWAWLISIMAGYKISEWICGPWLKPPDTVGETSSESAPEQESKAGREPPNKEISKYGIRFDEEMKHLGD